MKKKRDGWSVVLAGFWNRMIFTPEWVGSHLFGDREDIQTVVALLPVLPITYSDEKVSVEISDFRIVCRPRNLDDVESLTRLGEVSKKIVQELPQTPIQGIGVNIGFRESTLTEELRGLFNLDDNLSLSGDGWELEKKTITRKLTKEEDTLNLSLILEDDQLDIDFNFNMAPNDNIEHLVEDLPNMVIRHKDSAIRMLRELYSLELEVEDDES